MSLVVDISMAQVALIAAETAPIARRLFPESGPMSRFARQVERFTAMRADARDAQQCAAALIEAWGRVAATPEHRALLDAYKGLRGRGRQDHVELRLRRLAVTLKDAVQPPERAKVRRAGRRHSAA